MRCCDFCKASEHTAKKLIEAAHDDHEAHICDACVALCVNIIVEADQIKEPK